MKFTIVTSYWNTSLASCGKKKMPNVIFICLLSLSGFGLLFCTTTVDPLFSWYLLFFVFSLSQLFLGWLSQGCLFGGFLFIRYLFLGRLSQGWLFKWFLLPKCLFIRWLAQGWWPQWCLLVSFTSGCLGDDPRDCCPIGGSVWSSFLTGVSRHTGVFFPLECHLVPFLVFSKQNKTKLPVNIVAIETTWTKITKWQTLLLYHRFQNDSDSN